MSLKIKTHTIIMGRVNKKWITELGISWTRVRVTDELWKYLLWLTIDRGHPVFLQFYYLLPQPPSLWNKWRAQNQNSIYKHYIQVACFSQLFCFKIYITVQASTYHIHRSIEHLDLLILMYKYLVKPWLISTVF